jgi:hypothetical protein
MDIAYQRSPCLCCRMQLQTVRVADCYSHPVCPASSPRWMNEQTNGWMVDWWISMQNSFSYLVSKPESYWISRLFRLLVTVVRTAVAVPRVETLTILASPPSSFFCSSASVSRSSGLISVVARWQRHRGNVAVARTMQEIESSTAVTP